MSAENTTVNATQLTDEMKELRKQANAPGKQFLSFRNEKESKVKELEAAEQRWPEAVRSGDLKEIKALRKEIKRIGEEIEDADLMLRTCASGNIRSDEEQAELDAKIKFLYERTVKFLTETKHTRERMLTEDLLAAKAAYLGVIAALGESDRELYSAVFVENELRRFLDQEEWHKEQFRTLSLNLLLDSVQGRITGEDVDEARGNVPFWNSIKTVVGIISGE